MAQFVFNRYEKKYLIPPDIYEEFYSRVLEYMTEDDYGLYNIRNIYYDTQNDQLIRTSIEKPIYKEKFRVRSYGAPTDDTKIFLEIKKKYDGIVNKRRISVKYADAMKMLEAGNVDTTKGQIHKEIDYFIKHYGIIPKRYIAYDRRALFGKEDSEFRVTFDENIRSRTHNLTLKDDTETESLLPEGVRLMEVKIPGAMPLFFSKLLSQYNIKPVSFSKYGNFYKREIGR